MITSLPAEINILAGKLKPKEVKENSKDIAGPSNPKKWCVNVIKSPKKIAKRNIFVRSVVFKFFRINIRKQCVICAQN